MFVVAAIVVCATAGSGPLVPGSDRGFPMWEAGPLHLLLHFRIAYNPLDIAFSVALVVMLALYGVVLAAVRSLSMRTIAGVVIALHVLLFLSAPLQLNDVFNYLGYARLGALHGLNPYSHGIATILHDPTFRFSSWHHLRSPYGRLFSVVSYPLAWLPIPVAYWVLKASWSASALTSWAAGALRAAARARSALRGRARRAQPGLHRLRDRRLSQRLLHASADRWPRSRCCSSAATAAPARC